MQDATLIKALYDTMYHSALFVLPPLVIATLIAFAVGLFQAVTQIQEQTLPQTIKIVAIGVVMLVMGSSLAGPLYVSADDLFSNFARYERG